MNDVTKQVLTKVPAVTLGFWVIKVLATTLGETGGDTVTMTLDWGYLAGVALFGGALIRLVAHILLSVSRGSLLAEIVASTTFGTVLADFADRWLGIGYTGGSRRRCFACRPPLGSALVAGSVSVNTVSTPKSKRSIGPRSPFRTLGTALGDWLADDGGLGYEGGALVFTAALMAVVALYYWTGVSRVTLFWIAFILTRPLGATVGDFIDKPVADGGLALSRPLASAVIAAIIVVLLVILPQRPGRHPGQEGRTAAASAIGRRQD